MNREWWIVLRWIACAAIACAVVAYGLAYAWAWLFLNVLNA